MSNIVLLALTVLFQQLSSLRTYRRANVKESDLAIYSGAFWRTQSQTQGCEEPRLVAGSTFMEKYIVAHCLSAGAAGDAYVVNAKDGTELILKVGLVQKSECQFAKDMSSVAAAHFVNCLDFGEYDDANGENFMVMERAKGEELGSLVKRYLDEPPPQLKSVSIALEALAQLVDVTRTMAKSLHFHRDMHPGNVYIAEGGDITLIDYGIICVTADGNECNAEVFTFLMQQYVFVDFLMMLVQPNGKPHYFGLTGDTESAVLASFGGGKITDEIASVASAQMLESMRQAYKDNLNPASEIALSDLLRKGFLALSKDSNHAFPWELIAPLQEILNA